MKLRVLKKGSLVNDLFCAFKAAAIKCGDKRKSKIKLTNAVCNIEVVHMALKKRKEVVGNFLPSVRKVNAIQLSFDDFGDSCHMASSEPYFYDQS